MSKILQWVLISQSDVILRATLWLMKESGKFLVTFLANWTWKRVKKVLNFRHISFRFFVFFSVVVFRQKPKRIWKPKKLFRLEPLIMDVSRIDKKCANFVFFHSNSLQKIPSNCSFAHFLWSEFHNCIINKWSEEVYFKRMDQQPLLVRSTFRAFYHMMVVFPLDMVSSHDSWTKRNKTKSIICR